MSDIVRATLVFGELTFLGYGLLRLMGPTEARSGERLLLGLALALGLIPLALFLVLLAGGHLGLIPAWLVLAGGSLGFALWIAHAYRSGWSRPRNSTPHMLALGSPGQVFLVGIVAVLVIEKFVFASIQGFSFPAYFWDTVANWNYRAKILHATGRLDLDPYSNAFLGGEMAHYPLGPSLFRAWLATLLGKWSDPAVAFHSIVTYVLLFGMIWVRLSKRIGWWCGLVLAYFAVSIPLMTYHAFAGYADLLVTFFLTACLIYCFEYITARDAFSGHVSALFLAAVLFTKNEGIVLILPALTITVLIAAWSGRVAWLSAVSYLAIAIGPVVPWIVLKAYLGLSYAPTEANAGLAFHVEGLPRLFAVVFLQGSFNLFGSFFLLTVWLLAPLWWKTEVGFLALPVWLFFGAILAAFLFTDNYEFLENQMSINRTLMMAMPSYVYLAGVSFGRKWQREGATNSPQ
ncbi:MAG: hypothetical protein AB1451_08100 [Nitrospirota bacterium]